MTIEAGPAVTEGPNVKAKFKIISNVLPKTALPIQFTPEGTAFISGSGMKVTNYPAVSFEKNDWTGKYEGFIEIDIVDDQLKEPNGNVTVTLNSEATLTNYSVGTTNSAMVAVTDNDPIPIISVNNENLSVIEGGTLTIPINLSSRTTETVAVNWATSTTGGTAEAGDFTAGNGTLQIASGLAGAIQIQTATDTDTDNETFTVTLGSPMHGKFLGTASTIVMTITIIESDIPTVKFTSRTISVPENVPSEMVTLSIRLDKTSTEEVSVRYTTSTGLGAGAATSGVDFTGSTSSSNTATIAANQLTGMIQIPILDDQAEESFERFFVTLTNPTNAVLANNRHDSTITVTILDNESLPIISIAPDSGEVYEDSGPAQFKLSTTGLAGTTTLVINATPAEDGADFLTDSVDGMLNAGNANGFSVEFSDPDNDGTYTGLLPIPLHNDNVFEADDDIKLTLNADTAMILTYQIGSATEGTITILDDDELPVLSLSSDATTTGVTERYPFKFKISANFTLRKELTVTMNVAEATGGTNTLQPTLPGGGTTITFPSGRQEFIGTIEMATGANVPTNGGSINLNIVQDTAKYFLQSGQTSITVPVKDADTGSASSPVVSISGPSSIVEGAIAIYTLRAAPNPSATSIWVSLKVENTTGEFLKVYDSGSPQYVFDKQTGTYNLVPNPASTVPQSGVKRALIDGTTGQGIWEVRTRVDDPDGADGAISVTLLDGAGYALPVASSASSFSTSITDPPIYEVSINSSAETTGATEGHSFEFEVSTTNNVASDLDVMVVITDENNSNLTPTLQGGGEHRNNPGWKANRYWSC